MLSLDEGGHHRHHHPKKSDATLFEFELL